MLHKKDLFEYRYCHGCKGSHYFDLDNALFCAYAIVRANKYVYVKKYISKNKQDLIDILEKLRLSTH